jgi:F-type H+-transporting ATPase subunit b
MFENPETWVAVGFLLLVALAIYLKVPAMVVKALDARAARIKDELDEARRLREEAQALLAEYQRNQHEATREADAIIAQAREDAEAFARESATKLAESLDRRRRLAEEKIARAEADAIEDIRRRAADIAIAAAGHLLAGELPPAKAKSLVDDGIKAVRDELS